jgi:hypothetical protein
MFIFSELEWTGEEAVIVCLKTLSLHLSGENEETYEEPQSG